MKISLHKRIFSAYGILMAALLLTTKVAASTTTVYDSGNNSELLTSFPGDSVKRVLYSVNVGSLNAGDILAIAGEGEVENISGIDHSPLSSMLVMGSSTSDTSGLQLDEANTVNITVGSQRGVPVRTAIHAFTSASSDTYVNFLVWANVDFDVDSDYGRLQVLKIRP